MQKDTEKNILDTAHKHFVQKGFVATRTQEIADDAGINKAMLHYYFRTKEKLYQEVIRRTLGKVVPKLVGALTGDGLFLERVEHLVDTYIKVITENPQIPLFIMSELSQNRELFINEVKRQTDYFPAIKSFTEQMMTEMKNGKIKEISPVHLMLNILGMTIFPFISKPMISTVFGVSDKQFGILMKERKPIIMEFIKSGLEVK
jgi:AcrR family transcriptional regulator